MALACCVVSAARERVTVVVGAGEARFNVTPGIVPVTVLVVLEIGIPSTVSDALAPVTGFVKLTTPAEGVIVRSPGAPLVLLTIDNRAPVASVMTLAVTPILGVLLIVWARPSKVLFVLLIVIVTAGF